MTGLGGVFGQRRRYAVAGVLAIRGPMTAVGIATLVRAPEFVVRRDLAKIERAGLIRRTSGAAFSVS